MRLLRIITSLEFAAIGGALAGAALGLAYWAEIKLLFGTHAVLGGAAAGWLAVIVLAFVCRKAARCLRKKSTTPLSCWRRMLLLVLSLLALVALTPWLKVALPGSFQSAARKLGILPASTRPNLILISIDTLRPDHLGAYGSTRGLTPNLDAFAQESTIYEAAYVTSPWTLPSFGAMFTGRPPSACGLKTDASELTGWYYSEASLPEEVKLLPEALSEAGYTTAAIITNVFLSRERGWSRGFDYFLNENEAPTDALMKFKAHEALTVTKHARAWLEMNRREPFFLWLHYLDPHVTYDSPDTPESLRKKYPEDWMTYRRFWYYLMIDSPPEVKARYAAFCREMYAEEVRYVDRWLGVLLKELRESETYDESLVIITSDHGEELFDHAGFEHGHSMHEEVLWVPLMVKWPKGWPADKRIKQTTTLMGLAPTLLQAANAPPLEDMWEEEWTRQNGTPGSEVYAEGMLYGNEQMSLTTDDYKIIYRPFREAGEAEFAVFDRRQDRRELTDLAEMEAAIELQARLKERAEEAQVAAGKWGETSTSGFKLSETAKRRLQSLGYLGEN